MRTTRLDINLAGFEVGLSGAVPDRKEWTEPAMDRAILEFVALLTGLVVKYGGRIIHGAHPTFTPVILRQAAQHSTNRETKPVTLVMSELWLKDYSRGQLKELMENANLIVTSRVGEGSFDNTETRNKSLTKMRRALIQRMNVMVAVGGKLHMADGKIPGVREEMDLARQRGIACFLVGALGGMAAEYAKDVQSTSILGNELSEGENERLFKTADVAATVNIIFEQLASRPDLIQREFRDLINTSSEFGNLVVETAEEPIRDDLNEPPPLLLN